MNAIINWLRACKRRLDDFYGLSAIEDEEDDASDLERLNRELARLGYQQVAFSPPEIEQE